MPNAMTEPEIEAAIAQAIAKKASQGLPELVALRDQVQTSLGAHHPSLVPVWDALLRVASRSPDDIAAFLLHAQARAQWLTATRGAADPDTLEAWLSLGESAELECEWQVAIAAWEAVVAAPLDATTDAARPSISPALRGLGARRMVAGDLESARALFERDLALNEHLYPNGHAQLAISIDNLALVQERIGNAALSRSLRERERDMLLATGASSGQIAIIERHIARLSAP
jgi:hypothetical protein